MDIKCAFKQTKMIELVTREGARELSKTAAANLPKRCWLVCGTQQTESRLSPLGLRICQEVILYILYINTYKYYIFIYSIFKLFFVPGLMSLISVLKF